MSDSGAYRASVPDSRRLGWIARRLPDATVFERRRTWSAAPHLLTLIMTCVALAAVGSFCGLRIYVPTGLLVLVLAMTWPLPVERIRIDRRGMRWKDRLLGHRFRVPIERVRIIVDAVGNERALSIADARTRHAVAVGDPADVQALADELSASIERASKE
jgi:hypothetical protein